MSAKVKLKGFTDQVLITLATDPAWAVTMSVMTANELINGQVNRIRDGTVNLDLGVFDLPQIEDLVSKGLELAGLLKIAIETAPAKAEASVPSYIDDSDYPIGDTEETRKKQWKEISAPRSRNDGNKVVMFPSLTFDQYTQLKSETGIVIKSLKDWEVLSQDTTLTGYGSENII